MYDNFANILKNLLLCLIAQNVLLILCPNYLCISAAKISFLLKLINLTAANHILNDNSEHCIINLLTIVFFL